jgi:hypothetical protein
MSASSYVNSYYRFRESRESVPPPPFRRLRGYAFDPSLSLRLDTALINQAIFPVDWEKLAPGPVGEYVEVLDYDPASGCWYEPVNLDTVELVAQDGLAPSEGTPQFHQQMVYAVAMTTIRNFEFALGRKIFWAHRYDETLPRGKRDAYVARLRIYPHALRAANAYYSPNRKALLFGYFRSLGGMVFTCLSHDIIAHETTHALLDGMHRRYVEDNHIDSLAFHEAFADLVALFQHFTFPEVLRHQIARTRGDLSAPSLLGELAQQFGEATGQYGALRSAIGERDEYGQWQPIKPDPARLASTEEPHARGAILVAAVFGAFRAIFKARVADLIRLATAGSGELPAGAIHPDLVDRLAGEASRTARQFLSICIRALDYCPPVDITFGDYLRAMITSDFDMVPDDKHGYRVALIESFRHWGIVPDGVRTVSEEHLRWPFVRSEDESGWNAFQAISEKLRPLISESLYFEDRQVAFEEFRKAQELAHEFLQDSLSGSRDAYQRQQFERITGLNISDVEALERLRTSHDGLPTFEVHSVRPALRVSPDGRILKQMIMTVTQRRRVNVDPSDESLGKFDFRAGSTLIFDLDGLSLRYAVTRRIDDEARLGNIQNYRQRKGRDDLSLRAAYFGAGPTHDEASSLDGMVEPFGLLHAGD